jgi:hypothetical protein
MQTFQDQLDFVAVIFGIARREADAFVCKYWFREKHRVKLRARAILRLKCNYLGRGRFLQGFIASAPEVSSPM